jgi:hypothetical protein
LIEIVIEDPLGGDILDKFLKIDHVDSGDFFHCVPLSRLLGVDSCMVQLI